MCATHEQLFVAPAWVGSVLPCRRSFLATRRSEAIVTDVLIADNDGAISALLTEVLARSGLTVAHAFDGESARARVREPGLRVVVCDLDMPRASGLEVIESMADLEPVPPTVVISGFLDASITDRLARLSHVRAVLRKPFDLLAFAARVQQLAADHGACARASVEH